MKGITLLRRILAAMLTVVTTIGIGVAITFGLSGTASAQVGPLKIVRVGTDAMGTDTFSNRNREYVIIKNTSGAAVDINGLIVEDNWAYLNSGPSTCNTYTIASVTNPATPTMLASGKTLTVYNGAGTNDDDSNGNWSYYANSNVDCGTEGHFYNNDADTARLKMVVPGPVNDWADAFSWDWGGGYFVE